MKKKRKIPVISFNELELKSKKPQVYRSLVEGITEAFETKTDEIKLCEVKYAKLIFSFRKNNRTNSLGNRNHFTFSHSSGKIKKASFYRSLQLIF